MIREITAQGWERYIRQNTVTLISSNKEMWLHLQAIFEEFLLPVNNAVLDALNFTKVGNSSSVTEVIQKRFCFIILKRNFTHQFQ